jgi:hypothetical protein
MSTRLIGHNEYDLLCGTLNSYINFMTLDELRQLREAADVIWAKRKITNAPEQEVDHGDRLDRRWYK